MAIIQPFKGLRPLPDLASRVAAKPYDVLSALEAKEAAHGNPYSFYHVSKSEIDLPDHIDTHSQQVYDKAAENLHHMIQEGTLFQDNVPCYYIYKLVMDGRSQVGLVAASAISDYNAGIIKKHEFTRPDKELDRINHIKTTKAQTGNVFLAYNDVPEVNALIDHWMEQHPPVYEFTADDNIQHTVWVVNETDVVNSITQLFQEKVPCTYIADGHHRAASAALVQKEYSSLGNLQPAGAVNYFLTTIFPASQLAILDYNRVVKDLNGLAPADFLSKLEYDFDVFEVGHTPKKPNALHEFGMYLGGRWYHLIAREGTYTTDPIGVLDVTILSNNILDKQLGIKDQRTDKRIDFVGGIRGLGELVKRVDSGEMQVAFALYPVTIQQLFDIADSGNVMPPKSTWFEPKLRDGLITHLIA
ncbi:Uncharacterized conserved protein, DUF1015 family [Chitinophaga costaii]|uniref:Uncharacterized conserved protein, DUF1015 family n=1 Tax=Chitinophaga costaii TaxID=1335309 RepID=A0A1C4F8T7_9BACT|nr:DUF1015 family protein [Chitinophaga costaii]PUZ21196.1 DUF1015 domain-containing protein [Chitinophaga costaii]SCC52105.1 Uncharacterized conserved protein, DUF1015 family [Chitinophaga costaii]